MKKSKSSNPLLEDKNDDFAEVLEVLVDADDVAIAVGNTNDGESLPANPNLVNPVPLSMTTAGVPILAILNLYYILFINRRIIDYCLETKL
mmetsp:Transcript_6059/g.5982  ORF Transcript_6059/g.5982 Transcript_6059/m.5982 type:complete len:91 (-) Transcript_6059:23-295(-)